MIDARHQFSHHKEDDGDQSYLRFGFTGETQINEDLSGFGQWEYEVQASHPEGESSDDPRAYTRTAYAGFRLGSQAIDYGRNYGILYDIGAWTDLLPAFGNDSYQDADRFMTGRANGLLTWRTSDFFGEIPGLNLALQYQGKNNGGRESAKGRSEAHENGNGYGASALWGIGQSDVSVGLAWSAADRTGKQKSDRQGDKARGLTGGIKFDNSALLLAASYTRTRNTIYLDDVGWVKNADSVEALAQYTFDSGLQPGIAWLYTRGHSLPGNTGSASLVNYIDLSLNYALNKNMATYVEYKVNLLKNESREKKAALGLADDNVLAAGIIYQF